MFLLFRRQKSLALNTTDKIPGDNEFENYCRLKVVGTFPVRDLDTLTKSFAKKNLKRTLRLSDKNGYVRTHEMSQEICFTFPVHSSTWQKIVRHKELNVSIHEAALNSTTSGDTVVAT